MRREVFRKDYQDGEGSRQAQLIFSAFAISKVKLQWINKNRLKVLYLDLPIALLQNYRLNLHQQGNDEYSSVKFTPRQKGPIIRKVQFNLSELSVGFVFERAYLQCPFVKIVFISCNFSC